MKIRNPHRRQVLLQTAAFSALVALPMVSLQANTPAGEIARVSGSATIKGKDGQTRTAPAKGPVFAGDTVSTQGDAQVMIRMADRSSLLVRPKSTVVIEDFQFEQKPNDRMTTNVVAGAVRAVSGGIAKDKPGNVKYSAGTATIGIRGTDIELALIEEGQKDRAGIYNFVHSGATEMTLAGGPSVQVEKDLTGFAPATLKPGESPLQLLR
ncbi:MAG: FecR family protein, partial [Burkholderiaceae bacterium]